MKESDHYFFVRKWFDNATGSDIRRIDSEYGYMLYAHYLLEKLDMPINATVLEIGCGDGVIMNRMAGIRPDISFYGIDISENMINKAKNNNPNCNFHVGNIVNGIPYSNKFDRIYSFSVGQYLLENSIVELCLDSLGHISNSGSIHHLSIPDIKRRLPKLIDNSLNKHPSTFALLNGILMSLINITNKYDKDGSFWHSSKNIKSKLLRNRKYDNLTINIEKSEISWFRFDISIYKK